MSMQRGLAWGAFGAALILFPGCFLLLQSVGSVTCSGDDGPCVEALGPGARCEANTCVKGEGGNASSSSSGGASSSEIACTLGISGAACVSNSECGGGVCVQGCCASPDGSSSSGSQFNCGSAGLCVQGFGNCGAGLMCPQGDGCCVPVGVSSSSSVDASSSSVDASSTSVAASTSASSDSSGATSRITTLSSSNGTGTSNTPASSGPSTMTSSSSLMASSRDCGGNPSIDLGSEILCRADYLPPSPITRSASDVNAPRLLLVGTGITDNDGMTDRTSDIALIIGRPKSMMFPADFTLSGVYVTPTQPRLLSTNDLPAPGMTGATTDVRVGSLTFVPNTSTFLMGRIGFRRSTGAEYEAQAWSRIDGIDANSYRVDAVDKDQFTASLLTGVAPVLDGAVFGPSSVGGAGRAFIVGRPTANGDLVVRYGANMATNPTPRTQALPMSSTLPTQLAVVTAAIEQPTIDEVTGVVVTAVTTGSPKHYFLYNNMSSLTAFEIAGDLQGANLVVENPDVPGRGVAMATAASKNFVFALERCGTGMPLAVPTVYTVDRTIMSSARVNSRAPCANYSDARWHVVQVNFNDAYVLLTSRTDGQVARPALLYHLNSSGVVHGPGTVANTNEITGMGLSRAHTPVICALRPNDPVDRTDTVTCWEIQ